MSIQFLQVLREYSFQKNLIFPRFGRDVIDIHGHLQADRYFKSEKSRFYQHDLRQSAISRLLDNISQHRILAVFVSSIDGIASKAKKPGKRPLLGEISSNRLVLEASKADARIKPLFVAQPGRGGNPEKARRLFEAAQNAGTPFRGIKFHPYYLDIAPNDARDVYAPYMKIAEDFHIPVVFHTDPGVSNPHNIVALAKRFPTVPVVMYHVNLTNWPGDEIARQNLTEEGEKQALFENLMLHNFQQAANLVCEDLEQRGTKSNLYLECSWGRPNVVAKITKQVGADRMIFGTDMPLEPLIDPQHYTKTVDELVQALQKEGLSEDQIEKVFKGNAQKLFACH